MHRLDRMAGWLAALCVLGGVALLVPGVFFLTAPDLASGQSGTPIGTGDVFAILSTLFVCWGIWSYARGARRRERARRRALAGALGAMAAVGLVVLVAEIAAYSGSVRDALAAPPMLMLPTVLPQPDGIYRVRWSASGWQRVVGVLAGVALLADLAPVFAGVGGPRPSSPGTSPAFPFLAPLLPVLQVIVAFTLAGIVALGLIVACVATFEGAEVVAADAEGLSRGTGKGRETLGWQDITALLARAEGGKLESFLAVGSELEETAVAWPAAARWDGAQVAPGQAEAGYALAAVVAERTGLRWTVTPER